MQACFVTMAVCTVLEKRGAEMTGANQALVQAAPWGFMLGEYGLFIAFLSGMATGLR